MAFEATHLVPVDNFTSATILLPVMNETRSLEETVSTILNDVRTRVKEILILVCKRTTPEAMATVDRLLDRHADLIRVHCQTLPFLGGAVREGFLLARGSHVVMMASDLETDPSTLKTLIAEAESHPAAIITATRWRSGGGFRGYSTIKLVCNWMFQNFFSVLYGVRLSDMTFAYRVLPTRLVQSIQWEELRHAFLFESLVKPLRLGVEVIEVPSPWKARIEGESQNTFFLNFIYFRTGLKTRFTAKHTILNPAKKQEITEPA